MHAGKKALLAVAMATIVSGSAFAADQGSGKIKFKGVVIDAPCSIAPDSVDKEVDLGEVTTAVINANKKSTPVAVDINLQMWGGDRFCMRERSLINRRKPWIARDARREGYSARLDEK